MNAGNKTLTPCEGSSQSRTPVPGMAGGVVPPDCIAEWPEHVRTLYLTARTSSGTQGIPSHVLDAMRAILLAAPHPAPAQQAAGAIWPFELMSRVYNTLMYYANSTTYDAPRIGGVLQGCPRGNVPTPTELTMEAISMLRQIEQEMGRVPQEWMRRGITNDDRMAFLHSTNKDADGYEYGVAKAKFEEGGKVSFLWAYSDHSDIDALIRASTATGRAGS